MSTDAELIERLRSMSCYDYAAARHAADRLAALIAERDRLVAAIRPTLSVDARKALLEEAEADEAVGTGHVGRAILLLLQWHDNARAALSSTQPKGDAA